MSILYPVSDFWPLSTLATTGVTAANPPLFISGTTIGINDATDLQDGVVVTVDQSFGGVKNFVDGIKIASGTTVSEVSTDGTLAADSDNKVPTQKAVKTYIDAVNIIDSVTSPLYLMSGALAIYNASLTQSGVVTNSAQVLAGAKTFMQRAIFNSGLDSVDTIAFTGPTPELISEQPSANMVMRAGSFAADVAKIELYPATYITDAGTVRIISPPAGRVRLMESGGSGSPSERFNFVMGTRTFQHKYSDTYYSNQWVDSTGILHLGPTSGELRLHYNLANYISFRCTNGGDLVLQSSGGDVNIQTSTKFRVNNNTACDGTLGSGAFVVDGGASFGKMCCFFDGVDTTEVITPEIKTNDAAPLLLWAGDSPNYSSGSGASIVCEDTASGGRAIISAANAGDIRMYTGAGPLVENFRLDQFAFNVFAGVVARFYNTTQATTYNSASVVFDGGIGVAKDIVCNGTIYGSIVGTITPATPFSLTGANPQLKLVNNVGAVQTVDLGCGTSGALVIGTGNPVKILNADAATSTSTGALQVAGGASVTGALYTGDFVRAPRAQLTYAQDQLTLENSASGDLGYISEDTTGHLNLRTTSGKEVLVPSQNKVHFYNTDAIAALTVNGGVTAASIQFSSTRYKYVDLLPCGIAHPTTPPIIRIYGSRIQWACPKATTSIITFTKLLPEEISPNTQLRFSLQWFAEEAPAGGAAIRVGLATQIVPEGGNVISTAFTNSSITIPVTANNVLTTTFFQAPTPTNMVAGSLANVYVFLQRIVSDGGDTYTGHIHLAGLTCRYIGTTYGSTW